VLLTCGQATWAGFAASLGFELLNKNPWGTEYHYDDPRFAQTMTWWRNMIDNGLADAIWVGSKSEAEARKWVNFMASKDCQSIVATEGVVFPTP
jgi:hypothetical protein